uniref:Uncharacterized protein n=1 Tax=Arundo donax TaxID=35708 RepID=A0A0A9FE71_ARUDO
MLSLQLWLYSTCGHLTHRGNSVKHVFFSYSHVIEKNHY